MTPQVIVLKGVESWNETVFCFVKKQAVDLGFESLVDYDPWCVNTISALVGYTTVLTC